MRSMACRNIDVLGFGTWAMAANVTPRATRSHGSWNTGSSGSTMTGPNPCRPPRSCTPSTSGILAPISLWTSTGALRTKTSPKRTLGGGRPPVDSPFPYEDQLRTPRGQQGEAVGRGRRGRVRQGHRRRFPQDRQPDPYPWLPPRQGAQAAPRGSHGNGGGTRGGSARLPA